ncbi:hypothetical protein V8G54_029971 [Vigna mungo]|uniref:Integrase zinc-binding domain-containing protein n=1 Tax=Vigna mungo TaxID=3915 RepID=A0AAQ3MVB5_VIGMU
MNLSWKLNSDHIWCSYLTITNDFLEEIKTEQKEDSNLQRIMKSLNSEPAKEFSIGTDGILRVCVPAKMQLKKTILKEGHKSCLSIHPGMTKMYKDLKESFWWNGMKKDVAEFVSSCLVCQKAKIEHQKPGGMLQ